MADSRFFSKKEISEILTKASEIQMAKDHQEIKNNGLSKEELLNIAEEVGISREHLESAIRNYEAKTTESFNWLIGSSELKTTTVIDNSVSELQLDQLFPELNAFTGLKGEVEQIGDSYDWEQTENGFESIRRITVLPQNDKTKITHYVNWNDLRFLGLPLSTVMGVIAMMILLKSLGLPKSIFIPLSAVGGVFGYFGFMAGLKFYFNKQKQKFESVMKLIEDVLHRPAQHRIEMQEQYQPSENDGNKARKNRTKS